MPLLSTIGAASAKGFGLTSFITKVFSSIYSLRFNSSSSDSLSRTPTSNGNRKIFTASLWLKRSKITETGTVIPIVGAGDGTANNRLLLNFDPTDQLFLQNVVAGVSTSIRGTTQLFRDPSAWYHIVLAVDTTQATAANRTKIYINGSEVTSFSTSTDFTLNYDTYFNSTLYSNLIGLGTTTYFNGYMSQIYFVDGQALTPSSFGETDATSGIWKPKTYTGTYGTNGYYLKFTDLNSLGTDSSGNGNNFTVSNLTSVDQSTDDPTNNFSTMNILQVPTTNAPTFTEGALSAQTSTTGFFGGASTIGVSKGKWYWEGKLSATTGPIASIGIDGNPTESARLNYYSGNASWSYGYVATGNKYNNATSTSYGNSYTTNDILMIAMDLDNNYVYFGKNGVWQNSGDPTSGSLGTGAAFSISSSPPSGFYFITTGDISATISSTIQSNFGSPMYSSNGFKDREGCGNFSYPVPTRYYSLCTNNLNIYG
jgi:hypothetical protein